MDKKIKDIITELANRYETADFLLSDPSRFMHEVQGDANREATAFVASCLSYGSRKQFFPKINFLLQQSHGQMHQWIAQRLYHDTIPDTDECYYRLNTCHDLRAMLDAYSLLMHDYGSLKAFVRHNAADTPEAIATICRYFADKDSTSLVPRNTTSACKRVCMFLRWMVRDGSPVDLGLWADIIDKRTLVMPLDTHVVQESVALGILHTRTASMSAARKLTETMLEIFPDDPLKGDFALFGLGTDTEAKSRTNAPQR